MTLQGCPICGGTHAQTLYRFNPARWIPGDVVRCANCRTIYKIPAANAKPLAAYYDDSYAAAEYWDQEDAALRALQPIVTALTNVVRPSGQSLLDIGCGPGVFLGLACQTGYKAIGLELNPTLAQRARERTGAEVLVGDVMQINLEGRQFDIITMLDLIEHLPDPVAVLRRCTELVKPGGMFVVYTPNHASLIARLAGTLYRLSGGRISGPVAEIFDCTHLVFFDVQTLRLAMRQAGLLAERVALQKYDPTRTNQAIGASALALKGIEAISPFVHGQFRILMFARKPGA